MIKFIAVIFLQMISFELLSILRILVNQMDDRLVVLENVVYLGPKDVLFFHSVHKFIR